MKICGLTSVADAELAVGLGATHVGCVLVADSPRGIDVERAGSIAAAVGERAVRVLVFRAPDLAAVRAAAARTGVDWVQVHAVDPGFYSALERAGLRTLRVHAVAAGSRDLPPLSPAPSPAAPALLDVGQGGSGQRFDWAQLGERAPDATFIAGGIDPDNVTELLQHRPWGIDLSSGVEHEPGVKDPVRLRRLFAAIEAQDQEVRP